MSPCQGEDRGFNSLRPLQIFDFLTDKNMTLPYKKLTNGFSIPVIGLGTWLLGGTKIRNPNNDDAADIQGVKNAIDAGITLIDTAENYAEGQAERIVGAAIKDYDRKELFLTSKVDKSHLHYDDLMNACEKSLERLGTDYLDLYLIHAPNDEVPLEETMRAMDTLVEKGLVKNLGVSNFKTKRFIEAQKLTKNKIVTNQVYYNLINREPETDGLLEYCQKNDVILTAYRPIDKGSLLHDVPPIVEEIANKYSKTLAQIMLNWLISQDKVITIPKMTKPEHIKDNLGAVDWLMEKEDIEKLRKEFPNQIARPESLPLH